VLHGHVRRKLGHRADQVAKPLGQGSARRAGHGLDVHHRSVRKHDLGVQHDHTVFHFATIDHVIILLDPNIYF
jgi:hypothetical protein